MFSFFPIANAQALRDLSFRTFVDVLNRFVVDGLLILAISSVFLFFVWNVFQFLHKRSEGSSLAEFKNRLLWSVLLLFILVSVFSSIALLRGIFI